MLLPCKCIPKVFQKEWKNKSMTQLTEAPHNLRSTAARDGADSINSERELDGISPPGSSTSRTAITRKDIVVGLDDDVEEIKNRLISWYRPQRVLSIVGAGGTGKTTLAKLVYNNGNVVNHFLIRAWVTISQDYSVASILFNLLASLEEGGVPVERDGEGEITMESIIRRHLHRDRFLIVIDDMCNKKAWDDLKILFPDTNPGSRILLTTRLHDVATYVDSSSPVHMMCLLDEHHSWDLLMKKVFVDELCPLELEDAGKEIVKNCAGLPLSIVVVAGILSKVPRSLHSWKEIARHHGYSLYNLRYLHRLEKFKLILKMPEALLEYFPNYIVRGRLSDIFPLSLKRLTLCGLVLPWEDMRIIGSLPNLQVLKLRDHACIGENWETNKGEFGELRLLLIEKSNLTLWIADKSNFQRLEFLKLLHCPNLSDIPSFNFQRLELIELDNCPGPLYSGKLGRIKREKQESGNDTFQVRVKRS